MIIAIDAGHGHNTSGKRCPDDSMREHDFNSNVANKVCSILNYNGLETFRSDDPTGNNDIPLRIRTNNINNKNCDYCISIHANASTGTWNNARGIETYILAKGGKAEKLANLVQNKLIQFTGLTNRGVKIANFHILRETKMPAILCECGFMDNKEESELLKSEEYRTKCANAIAYGFLEFLNITPKEIDSQIEISTQTNNNEGSEEEVKVYQNGSTKEDVFADVNCTIKVGNLSPREKCDCLGVFEKRAIVRYKVDFTNNYKIGFVKWLGGLS